MAYEEYLDDLLSGVKNPKKEEEIQEVSDNNTESTMDKNMGEVIEDITEKNIFSEDVHQAEELDEIENGQIEDSEEIEKIEVSSNNESRDNDYQDDLDFLRAFDEELSNIEEDEFMKNFEWELEEGLAKSGAEKQNVDSQVHEISPDDTGENEEFFTELDNIVNEAKKTDEEIEPEVSEERNDHVEYSDDEVWRQFISENEDEYDEEPQEKPVEQTVQIDGEKQNNIEEMDIMEILNSIPDDENLGDIGDILEKEATNKPIEKTEDVLAMDVSEFNIDHENIPIVSSDSIKEKGADNSNKKNDKKTSRKKENFLTKFFKKSKSFDEKSENRSEDSASATDENNLILNELETAEKESKKKTKKAKEKKQKKLKVPKPPKVVEPMEPSKPLPKVPVILILVLCSSILFLVLITTNLLSYSNSISSARKSFEAQEYRDAYYTLAGLEIKEADTRFFGQVKIVMELEQRYLAYENYEKLGMYPEALNSLINGVKQYDSFREEADSLGVSLLYQRIIDDTERVLLENYNLTLDQARELYSMENKEVYTRQISSKLKQ